MSEESARALRRRWGRLPVAPARLHELADAMTLSQLDAYARHIEKVIGTVKLPVGLAGPLRVNGHHAQGEFNLPLATTEAALVASYNRGARLITEAGGCNVVLLDEGVDRSPVFVFRDLREVMSFTHWLGEWMGVLRDVAEATTRHGKVIGIEPVVCGNYVYLHCRYRTGNACGQNMVTIATQALCDFILAECPVQCRYHFIEGNLASDKKGSALSLATVRGKRVSADVIIPAALVRKRLHTTPADMAAYWRTAAVGSALSGSLGIQGHYANGLAALYIACGQDAACVSESAAGVTRLEETEEGDLYATVTLPCLMLGTVGGGTGLPSQRACLELIGLPAAGGARAFAEVCASLLLAGEISIVGALSAHEFTRAHQKRGRDRLRHAGPVACAAAPAVPTRPVQPHEEPLCVTELLKPYRLGS